jgi:hypothetical protein
MHRQQPEGGICRARESNDVITPYVAFKARWSNKPTEFQVDWFLKTIGDRVPAKDIGSYLKSPGR